MEAHTLELTLPSEPGSVARARTEVCDAMEPDLEDGQLETLRLVEDAYRLAGRLRVLAS